MEKRKKAGQGPLEDLLARAEEAAYDLDFRLVREWKSRHPGRLALGFLPVYVPREIPHAAGMLPVGIAGGGDRLEVIRGDAYFQSYICRLPRSVIELGLTGRLDALDALLFPSTCDVIRNLSGMWKLLFPQRYVRYFDVPQASDPQVGGRYYYRELEVLRRDLGTLAGRAITDADLHRSIRLFNRNRKALAELSALRAAEPWKAPAWEVYLVTRAGNTLDVEEHTALVEAYLRAARDADRRPRDHVKVVLSGSFCEQPPLGLLKTLERAGCYVVDDDLVLGARYLTRPVEEEGDPLEALCRAFLFHTVETATRYAGRGEKGQGLVEAVRRTGAEGVIFAAPSFCDPALLERPMLREALDRAGIPYTEFKYAENLGQFQGIREQAGTFADSVRLWGGGTRRTAEVLP